MAISFDDLYERVKPQDEVQGCGATQYALDILNIISYAKADEVDYYDLLSEMLDLLEEQ